MEYQILSSPTLIALLVFVATVVIKLWKRPTIANNNPPPGPWKLPLIGNLHNLFGRDQPHHRLRDLAGKYGAVMGFQLGQVPTVVISSAEIAKQVLKTHEFQFIDRPSLLAADIVLYNRSDIIFAPYGDYWRQIKKIAILELLSSKRVQSFKSVREEEVSSFFKFLYSKAGSPVNLSRTLLSLTNGIIAKTSIGKKCKRQEEIIAVITDAIKATGGFSVADVFPSFKFLHIITGISSTIRRIHREADTILEEIMDEHKANNESKNEPDNILDVLLDIQQRGNLEFPLTADNIKAIILEMFGAASDTSSVTIEWAMSEMMKNPWTMKKAQEEVREVFNGTGDVSEASLQELQYLKLVIKETLRLHPPLTLIPRECNQKCQINEYDIYPKTRVLVNAWAIGRDPNWWTDPERFDPERFRCGSVDFKGTDFEFIPFGAGKRMCPGITMAMANIELILAQLLYHFNWELPGKAKPETLDMSESFGLAVKRKVELNLIPTAFNP
ncbi:hypothetical protein JCGZ_22598 [Jatropha curcas]|uniref:CYP726A26 n=1 Tax=Jatropha curcas TaxID=180498 RepID=A0A067JQE1_JATCU|nr:uncharacterized protein LOC105646158 [Jatropha curcas]AIM47556.1 CYP726A26 [Jatropha curcas]KDP25063.1 hypothetical protein JCGZ_22598 [Jatropha curcas]